MHAADPRPPNHRVQRHEDRRHSESKASSFRLEIIAAVHATAVGMPIEGLSTGKVRYVCLRVTLPSAPIESVERFLNWFGCCCATCWQRTLVEPLQKGLRLRKVAGQFGAASCVRLSTNRWRVL